MQFDFSSVACTGILTVLPSNERSFLEDMKNYDFPESRSLKLKQVMGYDRHRVAESGVTSSDLAVHGLNYLFEEGLLNVDEIDAVIVVTQSPDYLMPPTSNVIQGRIGLRSETYCIDINQGCAGFIVGLAQGFMLLQQRYAQKVVLINVDVLSHRVSPYDRNSYPLIGDACAISILENSLESGKVTATIKMDGTRHGALMIPAGGFRTPSSADTAVLHDAGDGNRRALDHLVMNGSDVFNFVQTEVPPMIEELLERTTNEISDVDYFLFHQPNRFMLEKLAQKLEIPQHKFPMNVVENFGNSSGATIPVAATLNLQERFLTTQSQVCLAGFGVGLTWAAMIMSFGPLKFCRTVDY